MLSSRSRINRTTAKYKSRLRPIYIRIQLRLLGLLLSGLCLRLLVLWLRYRLLRTIRIRQLSLRTQTRTPRNVHSDPRLVIAQPMGELDRRRRVRLLLGLGLGLLRISLRLLRLRLGLGLDRALGSRSLYLERGMLLELGMLLLLLLLLNLLIIRQGLGLRLRRLALWNTPRRTLRLLSLLRQLLL